MEHKEKQLTLAELRERFTYNPDTGNFIYNKAVGTRSVGDFANHKNSRGYVIITINKRAYLAHRLAWYYVHGAWPKSWLDHINGIKDDNRIANLREVTPSENFQNQRKAHKDSATGVLGVFLDRGIWRSKIQVNGKRIDLGRYPSPEQAKAAYREAKAKLHIQNPQEGG